jgi:hypothetical protein
LTRFPTAFMPDRSFAKFVRNPDSDALLLPPIELTRFWKLCCREARAELLLVLVVPVAAVVAAVPAAAVVEAVPSTS